MPPLTLRLKLLLFAVAIAILPILVAGYTMIRIAQDELKSSANEQLLAIATGVAREINDAAERTWLNPLLLIRNAIDDPSLSIPAKVGLLTLGISDLSDVVALQITMDGSDLPLIVTQDTFSSRLKDAGADPLAVLEVGADAIRRARGLTEVFSPIVTFVPQTGAWLATVILPLRTQIAGADATLSARIDLTRLEQTIRKDPVHQDGLSHDRRFGRPGASRQAAGGSEQLRDRQGGYRLSPLDDAPARRGALCAARWRGHAGRLRLPPALPLGRPGRAPPEGRLSGRRADDEQPGALGCRGPRGGGAGRHGAGLRDQPAHPRDRPRRRRGGPGQPHRTRGERRRAQGRDRRPGAAHQPDDRGPHRAPASREVRLERHHGGDQAFRAPGRAAGRQPAPRHHAVLRHPRLHGLLRAAPARRRRRGPEPLFPASREDREGPPGRHRQVRGRRDPGGLRRRQERAAGGALRLGDAVEDGRSPAGADRASSWRSASASPRATS